MATLVSGRMSVAAGCLGVIEDCLTEVLDYCRTRHQHGKPIGRHQLVQEHVAAIELARNSTALMIEQAAAAKQAAEENPADAALSAAADMQVAQAKLFASNAAWDVAGSPPDYRKCSAAAAGRICIASGGICKTSAFAESTKALTKS